MSSRARRTLFPFMFQSLKRTRGSRPVADDASPRRLVGGHGPNNGRRAGTAPVAPHREVTLTGHALSLTSRPPRATGMCVLTAVRARVALVSRLSRPPGPGAPPGVTKSRMRIQVPACPRPPRPQAQVSARPQRAAGERGPRPAARAGYLRFCGSMPARAGGRESGCGNRNA